MMCSTFPTLFHSTLHAIQERNAAYVQSFRQTCNSAYETTHSKFQNAKEKTSHFIATDEGIVRFIKKNWSQLITYAIAWSVIVSGVGLIYGFQATAIPLMIGLGCGVAFGMLLGILTVSVWDRSNRWDGQNTIWNFLNEKLSSLDNGTRAIVISVCVTVVLAVTVVFPYVAGGVLGIIIGNHLTTKIGYNIKKSYYSTQDFGYLDLGPNPKSPHSLEERAKKLKGMMLQLEEDIQKYSKLQNNAIT